MINQKTQSSRQYQAQHTQKIQQTPAKLPQTPYNQHQVFNIGVSMHL